jgi:hypothetical protein
MKMTKPPATIRRRRRRRKRRRRWRTRRTSEERPRYGETWNGGPRSLTLVSGG